MSELSVLKSATWSPAILAASLTANLLALAVPLAMLQIYDRVIPHAAYETLIVLALMVGFALIVDVALRLSRSQLLAYAAARFEASAHPRALWSLIMEDPSQCKREASGTLVTRLSAIDRLRSQHADGATAAILDLPFAALFLIVIASLSPVVACAVALMVAATFLILRFIRQSIERVHNDRLETEARRHSFTSEVLGGIKLVHALQIGDLMRRRQERLLRHSASQTCEVTRRMHQAQGLTAAIGNLTPVVTAATAGYLVVNQEVSVGVLAAVVVLSGRIVQPVLRVEGYLAGLDSMRQAKADLRILTDTRLKADGDLPLANVQTLELVDVTTSPDPNFGISMQNVNLSLKTGDCLLLRSDNPIRLALAERLFLGELSLSKGHFEVNGRAISDYRLQDRQDRIRVLPEDAQLLEGTLLDNICAFQPERHRNVALGLARELGLQKVMRQSPRGLQAQVRSDNGEIPQSARRIASNIAGLVTLPDVIVFRAANSGLDLETDKYMLDWLKRHAHRHILIMTTNRPSYEALATKTLDVSIDHPVLQNV